MAIVPSLVYNGPYVNSLGISFDLPNSGGRVRRLLMSPFNATPTFFVLNRPTIGQIWPRGLGLGLGSGASSVESPTGVQAYRATNFVLADATPTAVVFSGVVVDDSAFWSSGDPTKITVLKAGWYAIVGQAAIDGTAGGVFETSISVNGITTRARQSGGLAVGGSNEMKRSVTALLKLEISDFVQLVVETTMDVGGTTQNIIGGENNTFLQLVRLV